MSQRRLGGRFFGRRVNCEQVPLLPAWAVALVLDDPRKIAYLLVWKSHHDGTVKRLSVSRRIQKSTACAGLIGLARSRLSVTIEPAISFALFSVRSLETAAWSDC